MCYALTSITIPDSVKTIEKDTFKGCESMTHIEIESSTPPEAKDLGWYNKLIVPKGAKHLYQQAAIWKDFAIIEEK